MKNHLDVKGTGVEELVMCDMSGESSLFLFLRATRNVESW